MDIYLHPSTFIDERNSSFQKSPKASRQQSLYILSKLFSPQVSRAQASPRAANHGSPPPTPFPIPLRGGGLTRPRPLHERRHKSIPRPRRSREQAPTPAPALSTTQENRSVDEEEDEWGSGRREVCCRSASCFLAQGEDKGHGEALMRRRRER